MKTCPTCKIEKPITEYSTAPSRPGGLAFHCRLCANAASKRWRAANREHVRRKSAEQYASRVARGTEKNRYLKRDHGITQADYDEMFLRQDGKCAICGSRPSGLSAAGRVRSLDVDHCHSTGQIRGLLCNPCNRGIGLLSDDPDRVLSAAFYLLNAKASHVGV